MPNSQTDHTRLNADEIFGYLTGEEESSDDPSQVAAGNPAMIGFRKGNQVQHFPYISLENATSEVGNTSWTCTMIFSTHLVQVQCSDTSLMSWTRFAEMLHLQQFHLIIQSEPVNIHWEAREQDPG